MRGISAVVAVIMVLMITVALASLAYLWFGGVFGSITEEVSGQIERETQGMFSEFEIESIYANNIYVRNTGGASLSKFIVYIDNTPVEYIDNFDGILRPGETGTITIDPYLGNKDSSTVYIATQQGATQLNEYQIGSAFEDDLVLYYKFDDITGPVIDSSSYGNDGTWNQDATDPGRRGESGKVYTSAYFNSAANTDPYGTCVDVNNDPELMPTNEMSIIFWLKLDGSNIGQKVYGKTFTYEDGSEWHTKTGYRSECWGTYCNFYIYNGPLYTDRVSCSVAGLTEWTNVAVIYDGNDLICYKNGVEVERAAAPGGIYPCDEILAVGGTGWNELPRYPIKGWMDDFRIYKRVLNPDEIKLYYDSVMG